MKNCNVCEYKKVCKNKQLAFNENDKVRFIHSPNHADYWTYYNGIKYGYVGIVDSVMSTSESSNMCKGGQRVVVKIPHYTWHICECNLEHI